MSLPPEQLLHPVDQQAGNGLSRLKIQAHVPSQGRQDGAAAALALPCSVLTALPAPGLLGSLGTDWH